MQHYKKQMTPQGEDYVNTAPVQLSHSVIINAPLEKVWEVIDDTPGFTKWFKGVKWGKFEIPTEKGVGAKRLAQLNSFKYYEEVIAYEKHKKMGFTMLESNSGLCETITEVFYLKVIDANTTEVMYKGGYKYKGIVSWISGIMNSSVVGVWKDALSGLKTYIETGKTV